MYNERTRTFFTAEALEAKRRVKLNGEFDGKAPKVVYADAGEDYIAITKAKKAINLPIACLLKNNANPNTKGISIKEISAKRQFRCTRTTIMPDKRNISLKTVIRTDLNISFKFSMSFVTLVTNLPTGFLSKNRTACP